MSKYTTGELARLCGVSVRTVQYYDTRGILVPGELTEGGRRLYSETDVRKMQVICFLRGLGFSLNAIGTLWEDENPEKVIRLLIEDQEKTLRGEITERQIALDTLGALRRELKDLPGVSVDSIGDIAHMMKTKNKLRRMRWMMVLLGLPVEVLELGSIVYGAMTGVWWPVLLGLAAAVVYSAWMTVYYFRRVRYVCPECHCTFKPKFSAMLWAAHTQKTRRLTCPECGKKSWCLEVYDESADQKT